MPVEKWIPPEQKRRWLVAAPVLLLVVITLSSSTVILPRAFVKGVTQTVPVGLTEEGFAKFWFDWWWLFVKGWHAIEFGLLFLLIRWALPKPRSIWIAAITFLLAIGDELHQATVPLRGARLSDLVIDAIGIAAAWRLDSWRNQPSPKFSIGWTAPLLLAAILAIRTLALNPF